MSVCAQPQRGERLVSSFARFTGWPFRAPKPHSSRCGLHISRPSRGLKRGRRWSQGAREDPSREIRSPPVRACGRTHGTALRWGEGYGERLEKALRRVLRRQKPGRKPTRARKWASCPRTPRTAASGQNQWRRRKRGLPPRWLSPLSPRCHSREGSPGKAGG